MPIISRVISLGKTGPLGLSSPTAACLTYARLISLLLSVLPGQSDFMIHQGPHRGRLEKESKVKLKSAHFVSLP